MSKLQLQLSRINWLDIICITIGVSIITYAINGYYSDMIYIPKSGYGGAPGNTVCGEAVVYVAASYILFGFFLLWLVLLSKLFILGDVFSSKTRILSYLNHWITFTPVYLSVAILVFSIVKENTCKKPLDIKFNIDSQYLKKDI